MQKKAFRPRIMASKNSTQPLSRNVARQLRKLARAIESGNLTNYVYISDPERGISFSTPVLPEGGKKLKARPEGLKLKAEARRQLVRKLMAEGLPRAEIANRLMVSIETIDKDLVAIRAENGD